MSEFQEQVTGQAPELPSPQPQAKTSRQTLINIVLLLCLALLFLLHFLRSESSKVPAAANSDASETAVSGPKIAYIYSDSIMANYDLVRDMHAAFEASTRRKENELKLKQKSFELKVNDFQNKVKANTISMDIAQITEKQLMQEQQRLVDLRDQLTEELGREEYVLNVQLIDSVTNFLNRYNAEKQYDVVFNFKQGTTIFVANNTLDITNDVIQKLNSEYRNLKPVKTKR